MAKAIQSRTLCQKYALGEKYPNVFFGFQETECMRYALQGKTILDIAAILTLSPYTVEYYFQKMRWKLKCHTTAELIEKVLKSDFLKVATSISNN
jgi:DNA-binding CsgD family transcriptional regulator